MRGDSILLSADRATASSSSRKNMGFQVSSEDLIDNSDLPLSTHTRRSTMDGRRFCLVQPHLSVPSLNSTNFMFTLPWNSNREKVGNECT